MSFSVLVDCPSGGIDTRQAQLPISVLELLCGCGSGNMHAKRGAPFLYDHGAASRIDKSVGHLFNAEF